MSSYRSLAELFRPDRHAGSAAKQVGEPKGSRRVQWAVLKHVLPASFSLLPRRFACYLSPRPTVKGLAVGAGPNYGAEFVFFKDGSSVVVGVLVVDPRAHLSTKLALAIFAKRGAEYWLREYPTGYATSRAWLPMPAACQWAIAKRAVEPSLTKTRAALSAALRLYLDPGAGGNASMSPAALFELCVALGGPSFQRCPYDSGWAWTSLDSMFTFVSTPARALTSWSLNDHAQPPGQVGVVVLANPDPAKPAIKKRAVKAPLGSVVRAAVGEIKERLHRWACTVDPRELAAAHPVMAAQLAAATNRKRKASASLGDVAGAMPLCIGMCLYPRSGKYAPNRVRYRVIGIIQAVGCSGVVDLDLMKAQWAANGSAGGLAELTRGLEHGKPYAVTCRALDAAGGCPHRGDVVQCCATSGRELPALPSSGGATPAAVWSTKPTKRGKPLQLL